MTSAVIPKELRQARPFISNECKTIVLVGGDCHHSVGTESLDEGFGPAHDRARVANGVRPIWNAVAFTLASTRAGGV